MKAVIFDMDGTLLDSVDLHAAAWQEAFLHFGHNFPYQRIRSQIGKGGDQLLPFFLSDEEVSSRGKEIQKYRGELFHTKYLQQVKAFPRVRDLFELLLKNGWKLALASSAKKEELAIYKEVCDITDLLAAEVGADDVARSKPHPDIFQAAVSRLGVSPKDCLAVGDSPFDAQGASKASVRSIGFLSGGFSQEDLLGAGYEKLYQNAADLLHKYEQSVFHEEAPKRNHR